MTSVYFTWLINQMRLMHAISQSVQPTRFESDCILNFRSLICLHWTSIRKILIALVRICIVLVGICIVLVGICIMLVAGRDMHCSVGISSRNFSCNVTLSVCPRYSGYCSSLPILPTKRHVVWSDQCLSGGQSRGLVCKRSSCLWPCWSTSYIWTGHFIFQI